MIYLAFYRGEGRLMSDTLVQWITRSEFSHCELLVSAEPPSFGIPYECVTAVGKDGGVRTKLITFPEEGWEFVPVPWAPASTWETALGFMGQGYDYWGLLMTQFINLRRHGASRWFCSKLCAHALGLREPHTYAPGDLKRVVEEHNRVYTLAHLSHQPASVRELPGSYTPALPGDGNTVRPHAGFLGDDLPETGAISQRERQWQPHINKPRQYPVGVRKALRPRISPTIVARREPFGLGRTKPFQLDAAHRAARGEVVDFVRPHMGQAKLER